MTPVINPWVFYLMPVCENLSVVAWILFIAGLIAIAFTGILWFISFTGCDDDVSATAMRVLKKFIPLLLVVCIIACLIPNEETITKMIVAQNVTVERVEVVSDTVVTVYNDIMNLFRDSGATNG